MRDLYLITPEHEAQLAHAITLLDEMVSEAALEGVEPDRRIEEVSDILKSLPFFAKNYTLLRQNHWHPRRKAYNKDKEREEKLCSKCTIATITVNPT